MGDRVMNEKTIAPPFACLERQMGYDSSPNGSYLILATVVLLSINHASEYIRIQWFGYLAS